jgi:hypothetical protein
MHADNGAAIEPERPFENRNITSERPGPPERGNLLSGDTCKEVIVMLQKVG